MDTIAASAPQQPYRAVKRLVDAVAAAFLLVVTAPILLLVAILVRINLGTPVLFRQERAGLHGRRFVMVKFRSMSDERGPDGRLLPDAERLGRLGRLLRATSLDELPELWNVLRGEMSLVGPRPWPVWMVDAQVARGLDYRLRVPAGWTGAAQASKGEATMDFDRRDLEYVDAYERLSGPGLAALDLRLLGRTVRTMLRGEGLRY